MDASKHEAIDAARRFIKAIRSHNFHIGKAIVFGSYAKGTYNEWSDIDVAIVSSDFCGIPFNDREKLVSFLLQADERIELHPFRPEEFTDDNEFVKDIKKYGIDLETV